MSTSDSKMDAVKRQRSEDNHFAARVLTKRDDITRLEKETALENILSGLAPHGAERERRVFAWRPVAVGIGILAVSAAFIGLWFNAPGPKPDAQAEFTPKSAGAPPAVFDVQCISHNRQTSCQQGAKLTFRVSDTAARRFFAAVAIRKTDNAVIWIFPNSASEKSLPVPSKGATTLPTAILLNNDYPPGKYEIIGVTSKEALPQATLKPIIEQYIAKERTASGENVTSERVSHVLLEVLEN